MTSTSPIARTSGLAHRALRYFARAGQRRRCTLEVLEELGRRVEDEHVRARIGTTRGRPRGCDRSWRIPDSGRTPPRRSTPPSRRPRPCSFCASRYASARITSRWRSASARIFSDSADPVARRSLATRLRSDCIRSNTRSEHLGREVDALEAHVDDLDAELLRVVVDLGANVLGDLVARSGDHVGDGALGDLVVQRVAQAARDPVAGDELAALHRAHELARDRRCATSRRCRSGC